MSLCLWTERAKTEWNVLRWRIQTQQRAASIRLIMNINPVNLNVWITSESLMLVRGISVNHCSCLRQNRSGGNTLCLCLRENISWCHVFIFLCLFHDCVGICFESFSSFFVVYFSFTAAYMTSFILLLCAALYHVLYSWAVVEGSVMAHNIALSPVWMERLTPLYLLFTLTASLPDIFDPCVSHFPAESNFSPTYDNSAHKGVLLTRDDIFEGCFRLYTWQKHR